MTATEPDLALLTGVRSGKGSYYRAYLRSSERMARTVRAMDTISRAVVRTTEGPRSLLEEVGRAAASHLDAEWTMLGLADTALQQARPRFVAIAADGSAYDDESYLPDVVRIELEAIRTGGARTETGRSRWVRVPMTLEGIEVGNLVALHQLDHSPEPGDLSVLRILANQAAVSLHTSEQYQAGLQLHRRAQQLYDETAAQAEDLALRTSQLRQTEERLLAAHQRELLDAERHRIARELHDSVSQCVLSAGMAVELARGELAVADGLLAERLDQAKSLTQRAVQQLRGAIFALHHESGDEGIAGLPELLDEVVTQHRTQLSVELRIEGGQLTLGPRAEHEIARVVGEALFNVAMHAQATRAIVRLRYRPDQLLVSVADDGRGDPTALSRIMRLERAGDGDGCHRGLANMAERADQFGGSVAFRRARLGGVRLELRIPYRWEPEPTMSEALATDRAVGIVLVDDHGIVRQGLRSILEREPDFAVLGEAATPADALAVVARTRPAIVLLDLKLSPSSDTEGLGLCAQLVATYPEIGVLVLTTFLDDQLVLRAIHNGARGYVVKDVDTSALVQAIRDIHRGGSAFDARSAAAVVRGLNATTADGGRRLTGRELEVLRLLATGLSNRDIGQKLFISETTAKFHVGNILRKLAVSRRAEAVYAATKQGLI